MQELWSLIDELNDKTDELKGKTSHQIGRCKKEFWHMCTVWLAKWKEDLRNDSLKKKNSDEDPLLREQTLNEQLELMTHMAQELDREHRRLQEQEQHLKIEFSSQEKDADLLIKQIIHYKKSLR